jgi:hypothetical protein
VTNSNDNPTAASSGPSPPVNEPLQFQPAANLFPLLDDADLAALAADIKEHGLLEPIWMLDDKILDGRNRYRACQKAGVEPKFQKWTGGDPIAFVLSTNLIRRHLNTSQRAMVAASAARLKQGQHQTGKFAGLASQSDLADTMNVSERLVRDALVVKNEARPEDLTAIASGKATINGTMKKLGRGNVKTGGALRLAEMAVRILEGIAADAPGRVDAIAFVQAWLTKQTGKFVGVSPRRRVTVTATAKKTKRTGKAKARA